MRDGDSKFSGVPARCVCAALALLTLLGASSSPAQETSFDLLIRGGRVMDGTGNPWFEADVAIAEGRIVAIGDLGDAEAERTIDAEGKIVAPGFIDLHSHADNRLTSNLPAYRTAPNLITQGITTVVVNPDGSDHGSIAEQRAEIEELGVAPNVVLMVGHNSVRRAVLKEDYRRASTPEEIESMRAMVRQGLEEGAYGLSAGLEYTPGIWATTDEVVALVEETLPFGRVFISHERSSGADPFWYLPSQDAPGPPTMLDTIVELIEIGRRTRATVVASHVKIRGANYWGSSGGIIQLIERARAGGVSIYADQYPYNTTGSDGRIVLIPQWVFLGERTSDVERRRGHRDYPAELREALADPETAEKVRLDVAHKIVRRGGPENIVVMDYPNKAYVGRSLAEIARERKIEPIELVFALQLEGDARRRGGVRLRSYSLSEIDVEALGAMAWTATSTDAGIVLPTDGPVHARFYGTYPRKIRHYAMERGIMTVESAIRSATSLPAQILGFRRRGQVREGFHADLVVFDPERIRDRATFFEPHQYSEGVEFVMVGGTLIVEHEKPTGALPGIVITSKDPER